MTVPRGSAEIRLAILWACWTGYMDAVLAAALAERRLSVLLVREAPDPAAPFDVTTLPAAARCEQVDYAEGEARLARRLDDFAPDLLLVTSWAHPTYRRLCRAWRGRVPRVMQMDNQWHGTVKQWLGVATSPVFVRRLADYAFVPGERQARFARRLGFAPKRILRPSLSGDTAAFAPAAAIPLGARRAFLFVGRLVADKGIDVLVDAYRRYRSRVAAPWPLIVCGTGPLAPALAEPGIDARGFVQPSALPTVFGEAACLVLPSRFEPYAVAVHEAAAAGLGIVCSAACGAGDDFVDAGGRNGRVVPTGDAATLAEVMVAMSELDATGLETVRRRSCELAAAVAPADWGRSLLSVITGSGT